MPDWSYRTVFRPAFFRLPASRGRDLALSVLSLLGRLPLGLRFIDLLGHMRPPARLSRSLHAITFPSPIGLGVGIDAHAVALPALSRFGFGFLEVGPGSPQPDEAPGAVERRPEQQAIWQQETGGGLDVETLARRFARAGSLDVPIVVRLGPAPKTTPEKATHECSLMVERLAGHAAVFSLTAPRLAYESWSEDQWQKHIAGVVEAVRKSSRQRPLWLCVPPDLELTQADQRIETARACGIDGVLIEGRIQVPPSGTLLGAPAREPVLRMVRHLRDRFGDGLVIVSSGGVHEPDNALQLLAAGANLVQIDSGLVYAGPGLPKRVNDAILFASPAPEPAAPVLAPAETTWFWTLLLGVSMLLGGLLALIVAATRVVLPYDESFTGLTREQLQAANPRLLSFMAHDRVTLAGTMMGIGALYTLLSLFGVRRGLHWARQTIIYSASTGFFTFFLFLGFGYFDPFHAFVTAVLLQFLLFALHSRLPPLVETVAPNLHEDWRWRRSLWGQLLFVLEGFGLLTAGLVISGVGVTRLFVHEDLEFLGTTPETLAAMSPHLLPLIAHDRASFGGMLIAFGLALELPALWGFRRGAWWLWWALLLANAFAFGAALAVHFSVGYTDWFHLLPAYVAIAIVALGLWLSYPYLCQTDPADAEIWRRYQRGLRIS
jgi:dihydroorotate dehydrogenase